MTFKEEKHHLCRAALFCFVAAAFWTSGILFAQEQDVAGSQDHPMVSRYKGSLIDGYDVRDYDRYVLALGKPTRDAEARKPLISRDGFSRIAADILSFSWGHIIKDMPFVFPCEDDRGWHYSRT